MEEILENAINVISNINTCATQAVKELKKMQSLFSAGNFIQLNSILEKGVFKESLEHLKLDDLYASLKKAYEKQMGQLRIEFDKKFTEACNRNGIANVQGNSMDGYRIKGIIFVKINFTKNSSEIGTFVLSKKINTLAPDKIADAVKTEITRLFERPFIPMDFLKNLFHVYQELRKESSGVLLLKDVYNILWLKKQKIEFLETADPSKMVLYTLDQFSVDLSRLIESRIQKLENGYECVISLGANSINIYGSDGNFNSYKFLEFRKG